MSEQTSYPLSWPVAWKRTATRSVSRFDIGHSVETGCREILQQLHAMSVPDYRVIISTNVPLRRDGLPFSNQRQPADPGVAVYFKLDNKPCVLACDKWRTVEHNLWAIGKHIEALRGQDRWGVGTVQQAFAGYAALPAPGSDRDWWLVLGIDRASSLDQIKTAYRDLARVFHPDAGGTSGQMAELNAALSRAKFEKGER